MAFFYNETKKLPAPKKPSARRADIPIQSLNKLGCSVCPKDKDRELVHPKMEPSGSKGPVFYLLTAAPTREDDEKGRWFTGKAGKAITRAFAKHGELSMRLGGITQCGTDTVAVGAHEQECCRGRVVQDIEDTQPVIVVGIGDAPLSWATQLDGFAPRFRGSLVATQIGSHKCWYYCLAFPNWALKESKYPSEHQLAMEHDIAELVRMCEDGSLPDLEHVGAGPYDAGIEYITGQESGDLQRLEQALRELALEPSTAIDLETNGLRPWVLKDPMIVCAAVGTFERTVVFPLDHPDGWSSEIHRRRAWELLGQFLLYSNPKEAHNLAFELEWFGFFYGHKLLRMTEWDDTMSMCHTLDERPGTKSLDVQIRMNFGFMLKAQSRVDVRRANWWLQYPLKEILRYNALDSKWTNRLARTLRPRLQAQKALWEEHCRKVALAPTLVITEARGLPVNLAFADQMEERLEKEAAVVLKRIMNTKEVAAYQRKFGTFSATNADHVLRLMDKVCNREEVRREQKGGAVKLTSDEEALTAIPKSEVPSAALILEHRGIEKQLSTYVRPVTTGKVISQDGMIHSKYSSMTAVTGRLAGEDPAPQNWPKHKHKEVRGVVAAKEADEARVREWMLAFDYGQIEFRVVGMASEDTNLVKYCWTGYDVHAYWAGRIVDKYPEMKDFIVKEFEVDWDEKGMKTLRQEAKNKWVFPQLFGSAARSCARDLHIPEDVADELAGEFWDEFPGVKRWQKKILDRYRKTLYVETLGGRRRRGPMTPNEIINHPIQGTAADIVTKAMDALSERAVLEDAWHLHPNLNVHDDLSFFIPDPLIEPSIEVITREMCLPRFDYINVPLVVEVSMGKRWSELKEIGVYRSDKLFGHTNPYL